MISEKINSIRTKIQYLAEINQCAIPEQELSTLLTDLATDTDSLYICNQLLDSELQGDFFDLESNIEKRRTHLSYLNHSRSVLLSKLIGLIYPAPNSQYIQHNWLKWNADKQRALNQYGYHLTNSAITEDQCDEIIEALNKIWFIEKKSGNRHLGYNKKTIQATKENTCWAIDQQKVLAIPAVQKIAADPALLSIIGSYLGCQPIHVQTSCWWSVNRSTRNSKLSKSAQLFHQDKEFLRFVKVFIYLTPVNSEHGPHCYVEESFKNYEDYVPPGYKFSDRISDKNIIEWYGESKVKTFTAPKGTVLIEDTNGFHKGTTVKKGHRLMLQLEYASSLYLSPGQCFSTAGLSAQYLEYLKKNPRFGLNYNNKHYVQHITKASIPSKKKNLRLWRRK